MYVFWYYPNKSFQLDVFVHVIFLVRVLYAMYYFMTLYSWYFIKPHIYIYIYFSVSSIKKKEHILAMKIKNSFFITFGLKIVSVYTVTSNLLLFFCDRVKHQRSLRPPVPFSKDKLLSLHHSVWFEAEDWCCVHCSLLIGLLSIDKKGLHNNTR